MGSKMREIAKNRTELHRNKHDRGNKSRKKQKHRDNNIIRR
jgi:hypothetical protein